jgi:hypothetical protein
MMIEGYYLEKDLPNLLWALDWNLPEEEQEKAIEGLHAYKDRIIDTLITESSKKQWYNAVKFIGQLKYSCQVQFVPQMLFLFKDMNWPGSLEAKSLMKTIETDDLKPFISKALTTADSENDLIWITWIKEFIEEMKIKEQYEEYKDILKRAEW